MGAGNPVPVPRRLGFAQPSQGPYSTQTIGYRINPPNPSSAPRGRKTPQPSTSQQSKMLYHLKWTGNV